MTEEHLFDLALNANPSERSAILDRECAGNPELRARIEALLAADAKPNFTIDSPVGHTGSIAGPHVEAGTVIAGKYKLVEPIGEGGMGSVWLAQQSEPVQRRVAVKLIKAGMDSRQVIARFEAERQALAVMDHPNIAKVLDGGLHEGRPYFVMELVKGVPITQYCDAHKLTPRQRLELFVPVCQAIQHAHQKGIIHRDIKPSNVLIAPYDDRPVPKVIDFGLAKATGVSLTEASMATNFGGVVGTPQYMSPEQASLNNLDIDTRSDVYSLGVLLYELLTGSPPFKQKELEKAGMLEILRVIREVEPLKPSTKLSTAEALPSLSANRGTEPKKLTGLLRNELDWIVMKALEKERTRRYETANGFAADINRYMTGEAVLAHPPSAGYRFKKFVRRNKGPVLAAGLVAATLVIGIIGTSAGLHMAQIENIRANAANHELSVERQLSEDRRWAAETREAETKAVLDFVENQIFAAARPEGQEGGLGHDVTLGQAVTAAVPFVKGSFSSQPLIEARLRLVLGTSFNYLGEGKQAAEQNEAARALFTQHNGPNHADTLCSMTSLAWSYLLLGRYLESLKINQEALERYRATLGVDHPATLKCMLGLWDAHLSLRQYAENLRISQEVLEIRKSKLGPDHFDTIWSNFSVATSYLQLGRYDDALKLYEETLRILKSKHSSKKREILATMNMLANTYSELGRHADALKLREETTAAERVLLGPNHPGTLGSMNNLASSYYTLGRFAEALKLNEETLALRKTKLGVDHPDTLRSMRFVALCLIAVNRGAEAVPILDECIQRAAGKPVDPNLLATALNIRLRHFKRAQNAEGCQHTAEMWENLKRIDVDSLYQAACNRAVCAAVIRRNPPAADATRFASEQTDQAMVWLKQAVAAGYTNVERIKKDKDLDPLRDRDDFKKLLKELAEKSMPVKK